MKYYAVSEEVLKSVLSYLMQRPYAEVAEGVQVLTNLPEIPVQEGEQSVAQSDVQSVVGTPSV